MPEFNLLKPKEYCPFANLVDSNKVLCAYSSRYFKNMSLSYGDTKDSLYNRNNFLTSVGIDYRDLVCAKQVHGDNIRHIKEEDRGSGALSYDTAIPDTDAFLTDRKNVPLAVFTADCLSLFLYDALQPAIGLIHAGWRSTQKNITAKAIKLMQELFATNPASLYVGFGPAIRSCCYEVGLDTGNLFPQDIINRNNRYYLDLVKANKKQALDSGVKEANIFDPEICTSCRNDEFFSYRKEGKDCGRIMSVIMLKG
jgi:hypothetical protein